MLSDVISFPGLGIELNPSRIAFNLFGHDIYWYGIILATAFLVAAVYALKRAPKFGVTADDMTDVLILATPMAIIFARLYYVAFEWDKYADNPITALYIWDGGVAIYGAIIGGLLAALIVTSVKKINALAVLDITAPALLIGQAVGRWGNFINREAYGTVTKLPWRMEIYDSIAGLRQAVHPTFLYESLWNVAGFVLLHFLSKKRKYNGQVFLLYILWYGLGRSFIEGMRTDSLFLTDTLRVSQLLGIVSCLVAVIILFYNIFRYHDPAKMLDLTAVAAEGPAQDVLEASGEEAGGETLDANTDEEASQQPEAAAEQPGAEPQQEENTAEQTEDNPQDKEDQNAGNNH